MVCTIAVYRTMEILNLFPALEFLSAKGHVIHGDFSIFNIMIHRIFQYAQGRSPSHLRIIASTSANVTASQHHALSQAPADTSTSTTASPPRKVDVNGTTEHIECSGMLIDCDFMNFKDRSSNRTSVRMN